MGARKRRPECKVCHKPATSRRVISWGGLCPRCGALNVERSIRDMRGGRGPYYERWIAGMERAVEAVKAGGVVPDSSDDRDAVAG